MPHLTQKVSVDLVVFDLDGTLADSLADLTNAANYACRKLKLPERRPAEVQGMIGGGERKFMERLVGTGHQALVEDCLRLYLDYYTRHCGDLTRLYPGVPETLEKLAAGKKLAVLSNKLQRLTVKILEILGIAPWFTAIRGGGTELPLKPSPDPLTALMRELAAAPNRTLMVGDKPADIATARGAGALVAAVTYGYGDLPSLTAAAPDFLLQEFSQLPEIVD
jgi:phosphoglycolate phosphatase